MGELGEMFPGAKLQKETTDEEGSGQGFQPGPLDLDSGVIRVRPRATQPPAEQPEDD